MPKKEKEAHSPSKFAGINFQEIKTYKEAHKREGGSDVKEATAAPSIVTDFFEPRSFKSLPASPVAAPASPPRAPASPAVSTPEKDHHYPFSHMI